MKLFKLGLAVVFAASFVALSEGPASAAVTPEVSFIANGGWEMQSLGNYPFCFSTKLGFANMRENDDWGWCQVEKQSSLPGVSSWLLMADTAAGNNLAYCGGTCFMGPNRLFVTSNYSVIAGTGQSLQVPMLSGHRVGEPGYFCYLSGAGTKDMQYSSSGGSGCTINMDGGQEFKLVARSNSSDYMSCNATCVEDRSRSMSIERHSSISQGSAVLGPVRSKAFERTCFLTEISALSRDKDFCHVYVNGGNWVLEADLAQCTATCVLQPRTLLDDKVAENPECLEEDGKACSSEDVGPTATEIFEFFKKQDSPGVEEVSE